MVVVIFVVDSCSSDTPGFRGVLNVFIESSFFEREEAILGGFYRVT